MRGEIRQGELEDQKKRLVDTFYNEMNRAYGFRLEGRIDYEQFGIRVQVGSKLNSVADCISAALTDDKISDEEFRLILSEIDKYNQMKEEIRCRQKQGVGLSEGEKKHKLIRRGREEAMSSARTKLLQDLRQAGKTGKST